MCFATQEGMHPKSNLAWFGTYVCEQFLAFMHKYHAYRGIITCADESIQAKLDMGLYYYARGPSTRRGKQGRF